MGKKKVAEKPDVAAKEKAVESVPKTGTKKAKIVEKAKIYINATYNNTMITVTDMKGNVLVWASAGSLGFVGPKKATPFAASKIVSVVAEKMAAFGINEAEVFVKGIAVVNIINTTELEIGATIDAPVEEDASRLLIVLQVLFLTVLLAAIFIFRGSIVYAIRCISQYVRNIFGKKDGPVS